MKHRITGGWRDLRAILSVAVLLAAGTSAFAGQAETPPTLPEAPKPQTAMQTATKVLAPCIPGHNSEPAGQTADSAGKPAETAPQQAGQPANPPCIPIPVINWFARFINGPEVKPMTPAEKARLALKNVVDPFNAITIVGISGISTAANPHSAYGPGFAGFGRNVGVSYAQDVTGEFFGTFLIPSIAHQDPHYHRMPQASVMRRFRHAVAQVVWTQGDNGKGMLNYGNLVGYAIDGAIGNLYVPGQRTDFSASATRYGIGLATAPADNLITEFLPDVARRFHFRVVLIQQIINQVARSATASGQ
jgi:hypothetical protein